MGLNTTRELVFPRVIADLEGRRQVGIHKYKEELTTFNGRSALQDAYEEALDLALYLKQKLMEDECV